MQKLQWSEVKLFLSILLAGATPIFELKIWHQHTVSLHLYICMVLGLLLLCCVYEASPRSSLDWLLLLTIKIRTTSLQSNIYLLYHLQSNIYLLYHKMYIMVYSTSVSPIQFTQKLLSPQLSTYGLCPRHPVL